VTTTVAGDDMIQREIVRALPAILAAKTIPPEDFAAG